VITSLQTISDYGECADEHPKWSDNAKEDYQQKYDDIQLLFALLNNGDLSPQFGSGSPEGVVTANYSLKYIDTDVPTEYFNETFGADTGWVAL